MIVVCGKCFHSNTDPNIEINFRDQCIYYVCPQCGEQNKIMLKIENKPFAKVRSMR